MKTLFKYQQEIVDSQNKPSSALFMQMGTGKTVTSLELFKKSQRKKILIICLLSKLNDWKEDLLDQCSVDGIILNKGTKKNKSLLEENKSAYIINFESAWRLPELLTWVDNDTFILIDESHKIKSVKSKIGKFCEKLRTKTKYKCILTGTPQSKGYIDYFNQLRFVDILPLTYKIFNDTYCVYDTQKFNGFPIKQLVGYKNTEGLEQLIRKECVFFDRDNTEELVPTDIDVKLPKPNKYELFKKVRIYKEYVADNSSKLFMSLRSMCSGFIDQYIVNDDKIQWWSDFIEDINDRVVIYYNFNKERDMIIDVLDKFGIPYSEYNGRRKDLSNFKKYKNGVAVCQYMSASTGLNDLVLSNICVMYSPPLNYTDWIQSKKRIDRIGQTRKPLYYNLYCKDTVEQKILETMKKGLDFDTKMFEMYIKCLTND